MAMEERRRQPRNWRESNLGSARPIDPKQYSLEDLTKLVHCAMFDITQQRICIEIRSGINFVNISSAGLQSMIPPENQTQFSELIAKAMNDAKEVTIREIGILVPSNN